MGLLLPGQWDDDDIDPEVEAAANRFIDISKLPPQHLMNRIDRGMQGLNVGISTACPHIDKYTYGTHMGRYYLIGADSGVGKTTTADFLYVINAWIKAKYANRKLQIIYYSWEISKEQKMLRWLSYFVYALYGESIPSDYIDGKISGLMLTDKHLRMVRYAMVYVEEIMKDIIFVEDPIHPTKMFHDFVDYYEAIGKVIREKSQDPKKRGRIIGWQPNDPMAITLAVCDHKALVQPEQGFDMKQTMDLWSKYIVILRNLFGLTYVGIKQFNTEMTSYHRMNKKGDGLIAPQRIDFGDSRYTFRDADVVFGLVKPKLSTTSTAT